MTAPSLPSGYDVSKHVSAGRHDCHITVGFDQQGTRIPRFLVQLHYHTTTGADHWAEIARMDHNETAPTGHEIYSEGLHVDIARRSGATVHLQIRHNPLPSNRGKVIRGCVTYLHSNADYFIDVYKGRKSPGGGPPRWSPDGGEPTPTLICENPVDMDMSQESPVEDALSPDELSAILAEATGTTAEEIEQGAEELNLSPPDEATVVSDESSTHD
ncbi:hypothetical protein DP107_03215 [Haloglomus irregulare]|uniref:DUF7718 domain-containing protein n=2 Tax=Haloglomus irregulare TaxID=2234134 RepID=A0A554NFL8_9EURY|nr:hypothetical protein DP107_03215 [Haloglomus irregulare]